MRGSIAHAAISPNNHRSSKNFSSRKKSSTIKEEDEEEDIASESEAQGIIQQVEKEISGGEIGVANETSPGMVIGHTNTIFFLLDFSKILIGIPVGTFSWFFRLKLERKKRRLAKGTLSTTSESPQRPTLGCL